MEVRREPKEGTLVPGSDDLLGSEKIVRCDRHLLGFGHDVELLEGSFKFPGRVAWTNEADDRGGRVIAISGNRDEENRERVFGAPQDVIVDLQSVAV